MLTLGIIGAENSHCAAIARLMNVTKEVGCRATTVWGETRQFAEAAAARGEIPSIVSDWREMLGKVDGIMITHRHAKYHHEPAEFFIKRGVPCFVDKPFTQTLSEGKALCRLALKHKVPIVSFSVKVLGGVFRTFQKDLRSVGTVDFFTSSGPADLKSKYGGFFFYGIHQVDPVIELFGNEVDTAWLRPHGRGGVATLTYRNGPVVTINCVNNGLRTFHASAVGDRGILDRVFDIDPNPYLAGAKLFTTMFRTGRAPIPYERMLAPIAVLEALDKSLKTKRPVKVASPKLNA